MFFDWDEKKSSKLKRNPKRAFSFEEVSELFSKPHFVDQRNDDPEQYFAIGWVKGVLVTAVFEYRIFYLEESEIEGVHLVTYWRSTKEERLLYEENKK
jgi:uncharacterized DUF497 family protein